MMPDISLERSITMSPEKEWQPTPVFLPGESHGQRSLACYSVHGVSRVRHNLATKLLITTNHVMCQIGNQSNPNIS